MNVYARDVLLALFVAVTSVLCEEITILQSATSDCPGELTGEICLTLEQFVSNPTYSQSPEIVLSMQSGRHDLSTDFLISSSTRNFTMRSDGATIACDTTSHSLTWSSVEDIIITGISFNGCGTLLIDKSVRVNFTDVSILNVPSLRGGYALQITRTSSPYTVDPASHAFFSNVSFLGNSRESLIWLMYTVILDRVTYINNAWGLRVQARLGQVTIGGSGTINSGGPQTILNMTRSIFSNNRDRERALSIYMNKAFISNSTFTGNRVGMYAQYVDLTIDDSVFSHNFGDGALVSSGSNLTMTRCTFMSNRVTGSVLLVSRANFLNLRRSTFLNNTGAVSVGAVTTMVTRCNFISNSASLQGGAINVGVPYENNRVTITRNTFTNNWAAYGGGLYIAAPPYIQSTTIFSSDNVFEGNTASISGGAIYSNISNSLSGILTVRNSNFYNNNAGDKSGGSVFSTGSNFALLLEESTFDSNFASSCGVLYADHGAVTLMSNAFTNNKATGEVNGGGVACIRNAVVSIENSTFTYNRASVHAGVLNIDRSSVTITDSTFLGNSAASHGGVIYTLVDSTEYAISHTAFSYNSAGRTGGVIYLNGRGNRATVNDSIFSFNSAARGGAVGVINTSLNITMSNIYNNTAENGSAISACNSIVDVQGLNGSVDNTQPSCILYDGFVDKFDIVPPHDFDTLLKTTSTSNPPPLQTNMPLPSPSSPPPRKPEPSKTSHKPTHTNQPTAATPTTYSCPTSTTRLCDDGDKDKVKRLTILVYTFVTTTIVLLVCVIALTIKLIYNCMKTKLSPRPSQSLPLGAVGRAERQYSYEPLKNEDHY